MTTHCRIPHYILGEARVCSAQLLWDVFYDPHFSLGSAPPRRVEPGVFPHERQWREARVSWLASSCCFCNGCLLVGESVVVDQNSSGDTRASSLVWQTTRTSWGFAWGPFSFWTISDGDGSEMTFLCFIIRSFLWTLATLRNGENEKETLCSSFTSLFDECRVEVSARDEVLREPDVWSANQLRDPRPACFVSKRRMGDREMGRKKDERSKADMQRHA